MRKFTSNTLVLASHNPSKIKEIIRLLKDFNLEIISSADFGIEEPEETETTFAGNARLKALYSATQSGLPALADDSGLVIPALNGQPGIFSARWAGPDKDFNIAIRRIEEGLIGKEDFSAYVICALALAWPDGHVEIFEGRCDGHLVFPGRGPHEFGYDPIFIPQGDNRTFAEMTPAEKALVSHRANAFRMLVAGCFS